MTELDPEGLVFRDDPSKRSAFFAGQADVGRLLGMITALTSEIAMLRARLDTHERLAAEGGFDRAKVESYRPDATALAERMTDDQAMIGRVFKPLSDELDRLLEEPAVQKTLLETHR